MTLLTDPSKKYRPFAPVHLRDRTWPDAVLSKAPIWLSTDLRDGNQSLIEPMNAERKLRMFDLLVGFPSASQTEFDFHRHLIDNRLIPDDVTIQVLTPAREELIRRSFQALRGAPRAIVHVYNAVAPVMRRVVFRMSEDEVVELAVSHVRLVRELAEAHPETDWRIQYSTEEHSTPNIFADMVEWMHRNVARRDAVILSIHPHNDRGTGIAAGEFALMAGGDRIEGCLFGNGERTGNFDVVNLALNLYTQGVHPGLDFSDIDEVRRTVEHCNQLPVHPRHPYVGDLVFTSFSGSHQDAIKKAFDARQPSDIWEMPYLPIDPLDIGRSYEAVIRVNSQSGKGGISYLLEHEYGFSLPRRLQIEFSQVVQSVTDLSGKEVRAADIWQIFEQHYLRDGRYGYDAHHLVEDSKTASVKLACELTVDGAPVALEGQGNGPIDAFVEAISRHTGRSVSVVDYHEHALTGGANARAVSYIEVKVDDGRALFGVGVDANIVTASLKAILSALNRALA